MNFNKKTMILILIFIFSIKRLVQTQIPDLNSFSDISDYILKGAHASESDMEDFDDSRVTLGQDYVGR